MTTDAADREPTELEFALWDRHNIIGWGFIGPLTLDQTEHEAAYERYQEEAWREHELEMQHGGRTRCPNCDRFTVEHSTVCTLGYRGHPGAEMSDYARCGNCGWQDLAG